MRNLKRYCGLSVILMTNLVYSQPSVSTDSLKTLLEKVDGTRERIDILNELAHYLHINERENAKNHAIEAISLSDSVQYDLGKIKGLSSLARITTLEGDADQGLTQAYMALAISKQTGKLEAETKPVAALGFIYFNLNNLDSMIKYDSRAVEIARETRNDREIFVGLNNLAMDYHQKGYYEESLRLYFESVKALKKLSPDSLKYFMVYSNMVTNYTAINDKQAALSYGQKAFDIIHRLNEPDRQISATERLAQSYYNLGEYDQALELLNLVVSKVEKEDFRFKTLASSIFNLLGKIVSQKEGPKNAIPYFQKSIFYSDQGVGPLHKAIPRYQLAVACIETGDLERSNTLLLSALSLAKEAGNLPIMRDVYMSMAKSDSLENNLEGYINNYILSNKYQDSLFSIEKEKSLAQLKIAYETELKDDKIKALNIENEIAQERQAKLQQAQIALIAGTILLISLIGVLYSRYRSKQKSLQIINQKNNENELLIKEIHHRVKNNLQIILSLLGTQNTLLKDDSIALNVITESQNRIKSLALIHENLYKNNNYVSVSAQQYFSNLLKHLMNSYDGTNTIVHLSSNIEDVQLKMNLAVPLGLILNELITNCYKYAFQNVHSGIIVVNFNRIPGGYYKLSVYDNGSGLPNNFTFENTESFGLQLISGLTSQLNGTITIGDHDGTTIDISVAHPSEAA